MDHNLRVVFWLKPAVTPTFNGEILVLIWFDADQVLAQTAGRES